MENNYQTRITPAKEDAVKVLKEEFSQYNGFIFTEYRGMTVSQMTALRTSLRENDAQYKVVKNRFAKLALKDLGKNADESLKGPVALALAKGDESNVVAKKLFAAIKDGMPMVVTGAIVGDEVMNADEIEAFSKLPTKLELIASLMGTMKAPVQKLAATLLAYMESKGGAPAAEAAEAPAEN
jgi:Ribosomal protein L10